MSPFRHAPPICRGDLRWRQGFSEPGAGSDLASLTTKAEDKGDHWLIKRILGLPDPNGSS